MTIVRYFKKPVPALLALMLVFLIPLLSAWWLFDHDIQWGKPINQGQLIQPLLPVSQLQLLTQQGERLEAAMLNGKWWLMYVSGQHCEQQCKAQLYNMRQIRLATGSNSERVARLLVMPQHAPEERSLQAQLQEMFKGTEQAFINSDTMSADIQRDKLYIIDPMGNIMMSYMPDAKPANVLQDLSRLLKVSQIG